MYERDDSRPHIIAVRLSSEAFSALEQLRQPGRTSSDVVEAALILTRDRKQSP